MVDSDILFSNIYFHLYRHGSWVSLHMFKLNRQYYLVVFALIVFLSLLQFQPKNVPGPKVTPVAPPKDGGFEHTLLTQILSENIKDNGLVQYDLLRKHPDLLNQYLGLISVTSPKNAPHRFKDRADQIAFYLNAYTAYLIAIVRDHCPIQSVKETYVGNGLFWRVAVQVGQEVLNLNEIASQIQSLAQGDVRYALILSKADLSSLPMPKRAWQGESLDRDVDDYLWQVFKFPWMEVKGNTLFVSERFKQYEYHFTPNLLKYFQERAQFKDVLKDVTQVEFRKGVDGLNGSCQ